MFCDKCKGMLRKRKTKDGFENHCPNCQGSGSQEFRVENEFADLEQWDSSPTGIPLFPYEEIRGGQKQFVKDVARAIEEGKTLLAYAPTGIGKTVGVLVPAIEESLKTGKKILFLTSKQSQHRIAIETIRQIKARYGLNITAVDIVNKQDMCPRDISHEYHVVFNALCQMEQRNKTCRYYTTEAAGLGKRIRDNILHVEELKELASGQGVCPHKAAVEAGINANIIICDYNYVFYSHVAETMLKMLETSLGDCIIIVDEAHNLPDRIRSHNSLEMTPNRIEEAMSEARQDKVMVRQLSVIRNGLKNMLERVPEEKEVLIHKHEFLTIVENSISQTLDGRTDTDKFCSRLMAIAEKKLRSGSRSAAMDLSRFIEGFRTEHPSIIHVLSRKNSSKIFFRLLDPSMVSGPIFKEARATILMSGTLFPTDMYRDVLGLTARDSIQGNYRSPFPPENRPVYSVTDVSTLYRQRSREMYLKIAGHLSQIAGEVEGNVAVFFPSYHIQWEVVQAIEEVGCSKELLVETRKSGKADKQKMLKRLRNLHFMGGGMLMGVMAGSLSEGVDYRDNLLSCVVVVGVPLAPPSLEQSQLEKYYDRKLGPGKGREYGYVSPAMNNVLQAMGRCIRSETDRAVVILMDLRYGSDRYLKYFPEDLNIKKPRSLKMDIRKFFS